MSKARLLPFFLILLCLLTAFVSGNEDTLVPTKLAEFTVYSKADHIKVTWVTHDRAEIKSFEIQRSRDGKKFHALKSIDDQGSDPNTFEFFEVDSDPLLGWSYYRLFQVLNNGDTATSGIAPVFFGLDRLQKGQYIAAKNPLDDLLPINLDDFNNEQVLLVLRDAGGIEYYVNKVLEAKGGRLRVTAGTDVPQGIYVITASSRDELVGLEVYAD